MLEDVAPLPSQSQINEAIIENGGVLPNSLQERINNIMAAHNEDKAPFMRLKRKFVLDDAPMLTKDLSAENRGSKAEPWSKIICQRRGLQDRRRR